MKLFKLNSKLIVAAASLASCAAVGAAPVAPTAGAQCAPADWGRDSPLFVQPALTCVHGTWMETSTLSSIAFSVSGVDKDGKEFLSYFQDVREGKANAIGQWTASKACQFTTATVRCERKCADLAMEAR